MDGNAEILVWADGTGSSECYWSERNKKWVFVDFLNRGLCRLVESWIEVTLEGEANAEEGLDQHTIACDFEAPGGCWVIDSDDYPALAAHYGDALQVTRVGGDAGDVLTEDEEIAVFLGSDFLEEVD